MQHLHAGSDDVTTQPCTNVWQWLLHNERTTATSTVIPKNRTTRTRTGKTKKKKKKSNNNNNNNNHEDDDDDNGKTNQWRALWRDENKLNTPTRFNASWVSKNKPKPKLWNQECDNTVFYQVNRQWGKTKQTVKRSALFWTNASE